MSPVAFCLFTDKRKDYSWILYPNIKLARIYRYYHSLKSYFPFNLHLYLLLMHDNMN